MEPANSDITQGWWWLDAIGIRGAVRMTLKAQD